MFVIRLSSFFRHWVFRASSLTRSLGGEVIDAEVEADADKKDGEHQDDDVAAGGPVIGPEGNQLGLRERALGRAVRGVCGVVHALPFSFRDRYQDGRVPDGDK